MEAKYHAFIFMSIAFNFIKVSSKSQGLYYSRMFDPPWPHHNHTAKRHLLITAALTTLKQLSHAWRGKEFIRKVIF